MSAQNPAPSRRRVVARVLIVDPSDGGILVRDDNACEVPALRVADRFYPEVEELVEAARRVWGVEIATLRCLSAGGGEDGSPRIYSAVLFGESRDPGVGFRWTRPHEWASKSAFLGSLPDEVSAMIRLELARLGADAPPSDPVPWDWPSGWHTDAKEWALANLPASEDTARWRIAQIRAWAISSVYRLTDGDRRLYFKASPNYFPAEVPVTRELTSAFPEVSPVLIASDAARGWMLMEDLGDVTLASANSEELWHDAVRAVARVQRFYAERVETLDAMGLERRTASAIVETLKEWIDDPALAALRLYQPQCEDALRRLVPLMGRVEETAARLDDLGLPPTLEHGDLDATNIFIRDGAPVLMDWSDACVSHPFFTPLTPAQARRKPRVVDAYLREWADFAPLDRLRAGFAAAKPLAALESAFHYHRNIVPYLPHPYPVFGTLERYIPELLNMAAEALERL